MKGVEEVDMRVEGSERKNGKRTGDNAGGQIGDGVESQTDRGGNGDYPFSILNSNANSVYSTPRAAGPHRDCKDVACTPLIALDANRGDGEGELSVGTRCRGLEEGILMGGEAEGIVKGGVDFEAEAQMSETATKTAELEGNNYSEEMEKIKQIMEGRTQATQSEGSVCEVNQTMDERGETESVSIPPGFEGHAGKGRNRRGRRRSKIRTGLLGLDRRCTRSQLKKGKIQSAGHRADKPSINHGRRLSIETTDTMRQEAEEALKVGEMLGVKVISHWDNAVKSITDTMKENRAARAKRV